MCPHVIVSPLPVTRKLLRVKKEEISAAICLGDLPCPIVEPCTRKVFFTTCATKFFHILGTGLHAIPILGEGHTHIRFMMSFELKITKAKASQHNLSFYNCTQKIHPPSSILKNQKKKKKKKRKRMRQTDRPWISSTA